MHHSLSFSLISCPIPSPPRTLISNFKTPNFHRPKTYIFKSVTLKCTSPIQVADIIEKDYSFLESNSTQTQHSRILSAAQISEKSKVLISFPTIGFVSRVVEEATCELVACVHDSLFVLAMIKEGDDRIRCFQGGFDVVPKKFVPFDAVFACYFPGMGVEVEELVGLAKSLCTPGLNISHWMALDGCFSNEDCYPHNYFQNSESSNYVSLTKHALKCGRLVICFDQGRKVIREHKKLHSDMVTVDLPDKIVLEKAAAKHASEIVDFVDEPSLYLAILKFGK